MEPGIGIEVPDALTPPKQKLFALALLVSSALEALTTLDDFIVVDLTVNSKMYCCSLFQWKQG